MRSLVRTLACMVLVLAAGTASFASVADERSARSAQWAEAAARQAQEAQSRQREARQRWQYERRRSAAHARMPNTMYASTPTTQAHADLSCPVLADEYARRLYKNYLDNRGGRPRVVGASGKSTGGSFPDNWLAAGSAQVPGAANTALTSTTGGGKAGATPHVVKTSGWSSTTVAAKSGTGMVHHVHLFPSASEPLREGFVRVINHAAGAGEVSIAPTDDSGHTFDALTLSIDANQTKHFNSGDLESGNESKGLTGNTGSGQGDWRLAFSSDLDIEVLSYIRTEDGFLTAMHDVAPEAEDGVRRIAIFNPGSNRNQVSILRLINPGEEPAEITIRGTDDRGNASDEVTLSLDSGMAREVSAEQLEMGASGLDGMLGDGSGKWRLAVESEQPIVALSLLESPTDHLTNLSTVPEAPPGGVHSVPLFPAAGDASGRQGFVRVINSSPTQGEVTIRAHDESERDYEPITLTIGANAVMHFNSDDLEQGNTGKGLSGGTGAGEGDWRLEFTSNLEIEVLSYIRTEDGFLTAMHDVAPRAGTRHRVAVFNPESNRNQESLLRLINPGDLGAEITIRGIDDKGTPGEDEVILTLTAGESRTVEAWQLESGADGLTGMLGDGSGKWQLMVESNRPVVAMSLLRSPTGHMTNLSTAPVRGARGGATQQPQTAEAVFLQLISGPIVQSKCITCHVEGGASGNTRLVFVPESDPDHEATNLQVFRDFLDEVEDGASYVLNKIQGALGHGGGIQVAAGSEDYANMERFLSLLGENVDPVAITPDTLFDGVTMESARSTLRRGAIIFAGRVPTDEEYESIKTGGLTSLRAAIRGLMEGAEFHEFLIRASNDRLLTDRELVNHTIGNDGYFVDFDNEFYRLNEIDSYGSEHYRWETRVQYGAGRAPLELIAHVVENDRDYREILLADYIMANPFAAQAYGADTEFDDSDDAHEFKPSEIVSYYRHCDGHDSVFTPGIGVRVNDPGPCATDYPHAGVLNTTVFLKRYPSTATNRNRARSRWTYYHFLGLDIEMSASRTTDPVALADTNNPTMNNAACTVCHTVMDPVAGAFQNYGDIGYYRDQYGGWDSLDQAYKDGAVSAQPIRGDSWSGRETLTWEIYAEAGLVTLGVTHTNDFYDDATGTDGRIYLDRLDVFDDEDALVASHEFEDIGPPYNDRGGHYCGGSAHNPVTDAVDHIDLWNGGSECSFIVEVDIPRDGAYEVAVVGWAEPHDLYGPDRLARLSVTRDPYRSGDTWYRDMREPGFGGEAVPNAETGLQWLAAQIVGDERFAEATVKFWWPAIMGSEVVEPPQGEDDVDFEGRLLASNTQAAEVARLARGFDRGFGDGSPYDLKDLLVEIVLSRWFRSETLDDKDLVRAVALGTSGARRLLTPEELARKTDALTGFRWGRDTPTPWTEPRLRGASALTSDDWGYRLFYGGIDSDGVTTRARDLSPVMAAVAKSHAAESSCPIVMREFYLLPEERRQLFAGIDLSTTPVSEFSDRFEVAADSWAGREVLRVTGPLSAGAKTVGMVFTNNDGDEQGGDRNVRLYELRVLDADGTVLERMSLKDLVPPVAPWGECGNANEYNPETGDRDHFNLHSTCGPATIEIGIGAAGTYTLEVEAWADQFGDELAQLDVSVESDKVGSAGARAIRAKLVDLHETLLGIRVGDRSKEVEIAYGLFVESWERRRASGATDFLDAGCHVWSDHEYFDGILEDAVRRYDNDEGGFYYDWNYDRIERFLRGELAPQDAHGVARAWVAVVAYLLMDYRYLYL